MCADSAEWDVQKRDFLAPMEFKLERGDYMGFGEVTGDEDEDKSLFRSGNVGDGIGRAWRGPDEFRRAPPHSATFGSHPDRKCYSGNARKSALTYRAANRYRA